jgi:hypothetical protein
MKAKICNFILMPRLSTRKSKMKRVENKIQNRTWEALKVSKRIFLRNLLVSFFLPIRWERGNKFTGVWRVKPSSFIFQRTIDLQKNYSQLIELKINLFFVGEIRSKIEIFEEWENFRGFYYFFKVFKFNTPKWFYSKKAYKKWNLIFYFISFLCIDTFLWL